MLKLFKGKLNRGALQRTLRIFHAIPVYAPAWGYGGPVLSVSRLCEAQAAAGHSVHVIATNAGLPDLPAANLGTSVQRRGVTVHYFPVNRQQGTIRSSTLYEHLPALLHGADLLHLSTIWQPWGVAIQRAAHAAGIPVLQSLRGALSPYSFANGRWKKMLYYRGVERPLLQKTAGLHVTSLQEANEAARLKLRPPIFLLPNPMDLRGAQPDTDLAMTWRQHLEIPTQNRLLLICGRQHHKKGLDLIPPILKGLEPESWTLLLVGDDEDGSGSALVRALTQAGLGARLKVLSTQPADDLPALYSIADLLLLPSRHENFGNVVVEALACGCQVAISDHTGVAGDLLNGCPDDFGLVAPREVAIWYDWLRNWFQQPMQRATLSAQWVQQRYGQAAVAEQSVEIYQRILQTHSSKGVKL